MAKGPTTAESLPPLPHGCIDRDALEAALRGGATGDEAIAAATVSFDHMHDQMPDEVRAAKDAFEPERPAVIEPQKLAQPAANEKE